jgi:ubiquinone/menaquinone biosynthesis C-methylase UbiE
MLARIKIIIGHFLVKLLPKKAKRLSEKGVTLNFKLNRIERLMKDAILYRTERQFDYENLAELHKNNWINQGKYFFEITDSRFQNDFLPNDSFIFDLLKEHLSTNEHSFSTLIEIGTGNGNVLNYLSDKFPELTKLIGIDLSAEQVAINNDKYKDNERMKFVATDGYDWIINHAKSNTIFVTYAGVLEYFTEKKLSEFLKFVHKLGKTIFVAVEPIALDHDFSVNPNTQLYGMERSFSHNYPKLFKDAGFKLWHESKKRLGNYECYFMFLGAES